MHPVHPLKFVACFSGLLSDPSLSGQAASDCIWEVTTFMALNLIRKFSHGLGTTVSVRAGIGQLGAGCRLRDAGNVQPDAGVRVEPGPAVGESSLLSGIDLRDPSRHS